MSEIVRPDKAPGNFDKTLLDLNPVLDGHDRLTVVLKCHYEHKGDNPIQVTRHFSDRCCDQEETYTRRFKVGSGDKKNAWMRLDLSYLQWKSGYIILDNQEGQHAQLNLSREDQAALDKRVIYACPSGSEPTDTAYFGCLVIQPGRFLLCLPSDNLWLRCDDYLTAQCRVTVFPK